MIVSDAPNCGITYDRQSDNRNSFIIQATGFIHCKKISMIIFNCHSRHAVRENNFFKETSS
jgi:hypothetical protein